MDQKVDLKHYELFIDGKRVAPSKRRIHHRS